MNKYCLLTIPAFLLLAVAFSSCMKNQEPYNVVVIHSYEQDFKQYPDYNRLIAKEFRRHDLRVNIHTFYLDCERYLINSELDRMSSFLDSIKVINPDIILVNEDQATYSLLECGNSFAHQVPIVFAGVNFPNWSQLKRYPNVTGFRDSIDFITNFKVIKELTGNDRAYIAADSTFIDLKIRDCLAKQRDDYKDARIRFDVLQLRNPNAPYTNLLWAVSKYYMKGNYLQVKRDFTVNNIAAFIPYKCFTAIYEAFGYGETLMAGYFAPMEVLAADQVGAAAKILQGISPSEIPITDSRKEYLMDWDAMKVYGVRVRDINTDKYKIVNINFVGRHPVLFYTIVAFLSLSLIFLASYSLKLYRKEINRRRKLLYTLEEERETLSLAINQSNIRVWKMKDGVFIEPNVLTVDEFMSFVHPDDLKVIKKVISNFSSHQNGVFEYRANFYGKYEWWQARYSFPHPEEESPVAVGLLINIQSFKDREEELERARDMAEKAELKESFIANMSHEIRTPLNAIVGFSNLLAEGADTLDAEEKEQFIHQITDNNELLLNLINDVLELSRLESGNISFKFQNVAVSSILGDIYAKHKLAVPGNIQFLYENTLPEDIFINTDKLRLTQVLTNFINNAFKFTKSGYVKIGVSLLKETHELEFFCEDTGIGIDPEHQKAVFARFYKKDEFAQGTGLGLSICSVIAEKLEGRIHLSSELGKGSRFSIMLPIDRESKV